jgi:hypothetical protein
MATIETNESLIQRVSLSSRTAQDILPHSALASANWEDSLRVYFQVADGIIRESRFEGSWTIGGEVTAEAKLHTPLAAVSCENPREAS